MIQDHNQSHGLPVGAPVLLTDVAKWMHAVYDRPPQSPEVRDILARLDAAVAASAVPQPLTAALDALTMMRGMSDGHGNELIESAITGLQAHIADAGGALALRLKALRQAISDHDAVPELDASNWSCKVCGNWTPHWHPERHAHADDCATQRDCEQRRATWKRRALAAIDAIEQNADLAQEDPGSDSACLKRVVEVSGFAERAASDEDIIDYVARLAGSVPVPTSAAAAESGAELLSDGGEAIAVEAFLHAVKGGHRHDLYKLPLRSKLRAAITSGPRMQEFIAEAGRKGWMSDTGSEPRINLVMFAWRAALGAAFSGRESPQTAVATEIWRLRFNTGIEGADEPKWMYVDGAAGKHFVSEVEGRPGWEIQTLAPTP